MAEPDDAALLAEAAEALGTSIPEECREGVAANMRLLRRHWATLREAE